MESPALLGMTRSAQASPAISARCVPAKTSFQVVQLQIQYVGSRPWYWTCPCGHHANSKCLGAAGAMLGRAANPVSDNVVSFCCRGSLRRIFPSGPCRHRLACCCGSGRLIGVLLMSGSQKKIPNVCDRRARWISFWVPCLPSTTAEDFP